MTVRDAFTQIMREGGVRGFYKGYGPAMVRSFPVNAMIMTVYDRLNESMKGALA